MKNLLTRTASTSVDNLDFDNSVTYRSSFSRVAKRPKLSTFFVRSVRTNWQNMERLAMVAAVVGSFALGFPVSTVHAMAKSPGGQVVPHPYKPYKPYLDTNPGGLNYVR